jgi:hypothetical protein
MPPLVCPSPLMLDHSFPRSDSQLRIIAVSLGELERLIAEHRVEILLTASLRDFVELFEWQRSVDQMALARDIYAYCNLLFLAANAGCVMVDNPRVERPAVHPRPVGCEHDPLIDLWADELGRILVLHRLAHPDGYFVAVACPYRFCGQPTPGYADEGSAFPLVGPDEVTNLEDAYGWTVPAEIRDARVSFHEAHRNLSAVGATRVDPPKGSSHYIARFPGARSWPLDRNTDPLPDRFLKELEPITGYPLAVIKYALKHGRLPQHVLRLGPS